VIRKFANAQVLDAWRVPAGNSARALRKAAHRVSFAYTPRPGYLYVRARAISSRTNDNWDTFPAEEIEKGYKTFLGKPAFINHHNANHRRARGVIVAAAMHHDRNPDGSPDTWVELLHEIDAQRFPKLAKAILEGRVNRTSMGVDCEYSTCSACGNKATSPAEYCQHMPGKKGMKFRKRGADGKVRESLIHEICAGLTFFENSFLVEDPADPTAHVLDKPYLHQVTAARREPAFTPLGLLEHFASVHEAGNPADYQMEMQPMEEGDPLHDMGSGDWPKDIYERIHEYDDSGGEHGYKHLNDIRRARGNPEKKVRIYRAAPAQNPESRNAKKGEINHGDWVTLNRSYAEQEARSVNNTSERNWKGPNHPDRAHIWSTVVPAKHVRSAGNSLMEWGYFGEDRKELPHISEQCSHRNPFAPRAPRAPRRRSFSDTDYSGKHHFGTGQPLYHGTRSVLRPGEMLTHEQAAEDPNNFDIHAAPYVHATTDPAEAHRWGERADSSGASRRAHDLGREQRQGPGENEDQAYPSRVYRVHPSGPVEPDLEYADTEKNSWRSAHPMQVGEHVRPLYCHAEECGNTEHWPDHPHYQFLKDEDDAEEERWRERHGVRRQAITGAEAPEGHQVWAEPQPGRSPVGPELEHNMMTREPHSWYRGLSYHGPYHVIRHPQTRQVHVVDASGRDANPMHGHFGNPEHDGSYGEDQAYKLWHHLESAGPDAHRIGTEEEPRFTDLARERTPAFPHSRIDPQDTERVARPDARVHKPEGYSPEDEWHGPYEVVKHPETGHFHVVDNAGRHAPGPSWRGHETQLRAERSRDYIDRRQQSKDLGRSLADKIWSGGAEVLDPGGTEESRQSEENTRRGSELMGRYAGGRGHIKFDSDEEGGAPYYEREHALANGKGSGWYVKHYGGPRMDVYHRATGDLSHDSIHIGDDQDRVPEHFDDIELGKHLKAWHDDPQGMRQHVESQHWTNGGNERIQRWKQRRQGARVHVGTAPWIEVTAAAGWSQEAADADNLYSQSGCHHVACGRWLGHGRTAALDIIEDRLHHPGDPAVSPVRAAQEGARSYAAKIGLPDPHAEQYSHIETNPGRIRRLAQAYHALPMNDPGAHAAFADMARQVHHQYDHLTGAMGVHVEAVDHDPYANHLEMTQDLARNRHLAVLSTRATGPHTFFDDETNDKFRAVHDAFGHAATGRSFDRHGEEAAWLAHSRMFSGPARHAMTTETRGQNSMLIATGKFAKQKTALLPGELTRREAAGPRYKDAADHPWFQANPVSKDNIKAAWYDSTDDEKTQGKNWYPDAHLVAKGIAGGDAAMGAGLLSAYSPRTKWPANMFHAARSFHEGRALNHSTGDGPIMDMHTNPARRILAGEHHSQVLNGPKTRAFAHLIEHGGNTDEDTESGNRQVVIDRHAMSVAAGKRLTDKEAVSAPIDKQHYYNHIAQKYFDAADEVSAETGQKVTPERMQATTWLRQIRVNDAEDSSVKNAFGGGGRVQKGINDQKRWEEHVRKYHPEMEGQTMHASLQHTAADPPLRVPPSVDTLRPEACPVCGDQDVFKGQRCPVCGFVAPPDIFRDPDIEHAKMMRQELEEGKETSPYPEGPADEEQLIPGAEPGMNPQEPIGSGEDADEQLFHPDQIAPDGVPGVQPDATAPGQGMLEPTGDEEELAEPGEEDPEEAQLEGEELEEEGAEEQAEGEQLEEQGAEGGQEMQEAEEEEPGFGGSPGKDQDEDERPGGKKMTKQRTAATAAVTAQQRVIDELRRENAKLSAGLSFIASLAGVTEELDQILRQADLANPAQPVDDPPQAPPSQTTEEALASGAPTGSGNGLARGPGHTEDDPARPGATPGSMTAVPAEATTTALTPGVEIPTAPATNLQDVTAPVQGTNPSQDGGVPIEQRRIETDVRVNPNPLAAQGPGIGGAGNDGTAFPWTIAARQQLSGPQSPEDERGARTFAAIRLAKLRVTAGLVRGDELELATMIERDASLSLHDIEREIGTLGQVTKAAAVSQAQPRYPRTMAPRTASRAAPSFSGEPAPVMAMTAGLGGPDDDGDLFD
jgi:hypothetical protein